MNQQTFTAVLNSLSPGDAEAIRWKIESILLNSDKEKERRLILQETVELCLKLRNENTWSSDTCEAVDEILSNGWKLFTEKL